MSRELKSWLRRENWCCCGASLNGSRYDCDYFGCCQHYQNQHGFPLIKGRWCWVKALTLQPINDNGNVSVFDKCPRTRPNTSNKQSKLMSSLINYFYKIGLLFFLCLSNDQTYRATTSSIVAELFIKVSPLSLKMADINATRWVREP